MKQAKLYILIGLLAFLFASFNVVYNLKSDKKLVQASYLQLACEGCTHMEVVKSSDKSLLSKVIIPQSGNYDTDSIMPVSSITDPYLCLEGYLYKFNFSNLIGINPNGIRFEVLKPHPLEYCSTLEFTSNQ